MKNSKDNLYQELTDKIIAELEKGNIPWKKSWTRFGLAKNWSTKKAYKGINMFILNFLNDFDIPYFLTYKQALALGGHVSKGSKALRVYYYNVLFKDSDGKKISTKEAENRDDVTIIKYLKYYNVFNVKDIEGIEFDFREVEHRQNNEIEVCEDIYSNYPNRPILKHTEVSRAFYAPQSDSVHLPTRNSFDSSENYYCTLFHELIHSTGHISRLQRDGITNTSDFGSTSYSREELIAEIGASFLSNIAGIQDMELFQNSTAYIQGWLNQLKNDSKLIFKASAEAQKAVDYILLE